MQKTSFEFEILIHDDASTDGTIALIREYEDKHPGIIRTIIQTENQYSQGQRGINFKYNFPRAKGKYIALCEGDDCWTDPLKLQKQVDFLEQNEHYSFVTGGFVALNSNTGHRKIIIHQDKEVKGNMDLSDHRSKGFDITLEKVKHEWLTKTLTSLFRKDCIDLDTLNQYRFARDVHLFYHLLKKEKGYYMQEVLGVYNIHEGGIFSLTSAEKRLLDHYYLYQELYQVNKDEFSRYKYFNLILKVLNFKVSSLLKTNTFNAFSLTKDALRLMKGPGEMGMFMKALIPKKIREKIKNK